MSRVLVINVPYATHCDGCNCHKQLSDLDKPSEGKAHRNAGAAERKAARLQKFPKSGTDRRKVVEALARHTFGLADFQIAKVTGLLPYTAAPRRTELVEGNWVEKAGRTVPTGNGEAVAEVWRLTGKAREELRRQGWLL